MRSVTVSSIAGRTYAVEVNAGRHALVSDEAEEDGGEDLGPGPYELLLAALGSCTAITLAMYARRKQWPLESVTVELSHEKVFARDCAECSAEEIAVGPDRRIDLIRKDVFVRGPLDAEQTARLLEIADRCPVNRTLLTPPKIVSSIAAID
jgi:putative redox protein